ncbi:hypothetical protein Tco_1260865 [Tanacetum coccineum]
MSCPPTSTHMTLGQYLKLHISGISVWNKDHPDAYKWIEANGQWLYDNFDHCDVETSDDDGDARSLWSSDDDEHFDPFEDDPTHPDARWSP